MGTGGTTGRITAAAEGEESPAKKKGLLPAAGGRGERALVARHRHRLLLLRLRVFELAGDEVRVGALVQIRQELGAEAGAFRWRDVTVGHLRQFGYELLRVPVDVQRFFAEQVGGGGFVDVRLRSPGSARTLGPC